MSHHAHYLYYRLKPSTLCFPLIIVSIETIEIVFQYPLPSLFVVLVEIITTGCHVHYEYYRHYQLRQSKLFYIIYSTTPFTLSVGNSRLFYMHSILIIPMSLKQSKLLHHITLPALFKFSDKTTKIVLSCIVSPLFMLSIETTNLAFHVSYPYYLYCQW